MVKLIKYNKDYLDKHKNSYFIDNGNLYEGSFYDKIAVRAQGKFKIKNKIYKQ